MPSLQTRANTIRLPIVGRIHSLRLTAESLTFLLAVSNGNRSSNDFACHSNRPDVMAAAADLEPGQLVGIIGVAPKAAAPHGGFHVERLELLGRKIRREALA